METRWQNEYRDRIMSRSASHERGYFALLRQLSLELHTLQDEFVNRPIGKQYYSFEIFAISLNRILQNFFDHTHRRSLICTVTHLVAFKAFIDSRMAVDRSPKHVVNRFRRYTSLHDHLQLEKV